MFLKDSYRFSFLLSYVGFSFSNVSFPLLLRAPYNIVLILFLNCFRPFWDSTSTFLLLVSYAGKCFSVLMGQTSYPLISSDNSLLPLQYFYPSLFSAIQYSSWFSRMDNSS
ncbi:hypothetical protein CW304_11745 [Bacillus sp. UFRGS-B20]|nr:hypothetical protein CW304_11745 [Bacillus sp. UFRGS-B20]